MSYIDLHMHSAYSDDGEFSPKELVDICLGKGVRYFSIADHNSVKAICEAQQYCQGKSIEIIPAVELDCSFAGVNLHLLGYGIDYHNPRFNEIETSILVQEQTASKERLALVRKLGIDFADEAIALLAKNGVINGEMIAEAAMQFAKAQDNPLLQPYFPGGARSDNPYVNFYWDYCAKGQPAYVKVEFITLAEAVKVIEQSGGVPVLAHPGNNVKEDAALLEAITASGVKGLEAYSSYHSEGQVQYYKGFAARYNLLVTSGSDFHGKTKPSILVGSSECESEDSIITALKAAIRK
jgi:predicted metal-dependent phosphoesterase TrpH